VNQLYYNELKNIPELTKDEFKILFEKYKNGNQKSKDIIIKCNLKLAVYFANKYKNVNPAIELDDLISEANIGLIKSLDLYDLSKEIKFSYYASFWIKKALIDYISNFNLINKPYSFNKQIDVKIKELTQELQTEVDETLLEYYSTFSLNEILNYFNTPTYSNQEINLFEEEEKEEYNIELIKSFIQFLNEKEQQVLNYFFGINQNKLCYKEIAKKINLSERRVYQIRNNALNKIKKIYENQI
jgi:RNA polymerase primary sigma factor